LSGAGRCATAVRQDVDGLKVDDDRSAALSHRAHVLVEAGEPVSEELGEATRAARAPDGREEHSALAGRGCAADCGGVICAGSTGRGR
jgi:hypothetical protein